MSTALTICVAQLQNPTITSKEGYPHGYIFWDMSFFLRNEDPTDDASPSIFKTALVRHYNRRKPVKEGTEVYALCIVAVRTVFLVT